MRYRVTLGYDKEPGQTKVDVFCITLDEARVRAYEWYRRLSYERGGSGLPYPPSL